jgi:hypothetical protein
MKNFNRTIASNSKSDYSKLIPKLIEQSNNLKNELKLRLKCNTFFSEFESKASNQFNFFIKESRARYFASRSGCNLDSLIENSKSKRLNEANKIINDDFYSQNDILSEREKMKLKTTNRMYKHFRETVSQLKNLAKSNSCRYNIENKRNLKKVRKNMMKKSLSKNSNEQLIKDKNDMKFLMYNEKKLIKGHVDKYKNELNKMMTMTNATQKYSFAHKKMFFSLPKINLLTYEKLEEKPIDPDEEELKNRVNFKKLLPYSRMGKNLGYISNHSEEKDKKNAFITEPYINNNNHNFNNIKYKGNTNEVVLSSAKGEFDIRARFNKKRLLIEDMLRIDDIPKLNRYDTIVKNIYRRRRLERKLRMGKNKYFDFRKEEINSNVKDRVNDNINEGFKILDEAEKNLLTHNSKFI